MCKLNFSKMEWMDSLKMNYIIFMLLKTAHITKGIKFTVLHSPSAELYGFTGENLEIFSQK